MIFIFKQFWNDYLINKMAYLRCYINKDLNCSFYSEPFKSVNEKDYLLDKMIDK